MYRNPLRIVSQALPFACLVVLGCSGSPIDPDSNSAPELVPDRPPPTVETPAQAVIDRTLLVGLPDYGSARAQDFADRSFVVFPLRAILSEDGAANVAAIRAVNPDIVILGSVQLLSIVEHWNADWHRPRMTLGAQMWDILNERPVYTTTGDVALMWDNMPMLNPMRDGQLDEVMLEDLIDAIVEHFARWPGVADGIMHDYTSRSPWIYPSPEEASIGEVDLDQDGIPFAEDPAEAQVWYAWQEQLMVRLQRRLGVGLVQIANGALPMQRPDFARHLAGVWMQDYPTLPWNVTPREGFEQLIELMGPDGLTPRLGRTWNLLAPATVTDLGDVQLRRMASLLTGAHYSYRQSTGDLFSAGDPAPIELGPAIDTMVSERLEDGGLRLSRTFRDGQVVVEFTASGSVGSSRVDSQN